MPASVKRLTEAGTLQMTASVNGLKNKKSLELVGEPIFEPTGEPIIASVNRSANVLH